MFQWNQIPDNLYTDFSFPGNRNELFSSDSPCFISLLKLSSDEINNNLMSVCDDIITSPLFILIHFNILVSSLPIISDIHKSIISEILNALIVCGKEIISFIRSMYDKSKSIQTTAKENSILTSCLMRVVYLVSEIFAELFRDCFRETEIYKRSNLSQKRMAYDPISADIVILFENLLEFSNAVLSTDIMIIFTPPVPESIIDTIRVMFAPVYLILNQNTLLKKLSYKLVQSIFLCLNRFPFLLIEVGIKISEVLQYSDSGQGVGPVIQNFLKQIIELIPNLSGQIIREVTSRLYLGKDIPEAKILGSVLATVACCDHVQVKSNLNYIIPLLSSECFTIRNGALTAVTEIIRENYNTCKGSTGQIEICLLSSFKKHNKFGFGDKTFDSMECKLLNTLINHLYDINAFVRSRCIHLLNTLWESGSIPLVKQNGILQFLIERLLDKSAIVRKQSSLILVMAMKKHPYKTPILDILSFQQCLHRELKILREMENREIWKLCNHLDSIDTVLNTDIQEILKSNENVNMINEDPTNVDLLYQRFESEISIGFIPDCIAAFDCLKRSINNAKTIFKNEELKEQPIILCLTHHDLLILSTIIRRSKLKDPPDYTNQYKSQKMKVIFLQSAIEFIQLLETCLPTAINFLNSKVHSDVTSAIAFLTEYRKFKLPDHLTCIKPILYLIWSPQQAHQECALYCFSELFMNKFEPQPDYDFIAQVLCKDLLININYREFNTIEKIVMTLVKRKEFPNKLKLALFNYFNLSQELTVSTTKTNALIILCMIGKEDPDIIYDNMFNLVSNCFAKSVLDTDIVMYGCRALNIITSYRNKHKYNIPRFINTHTIFDFIVVFLTTNMFNCASNWTCLMHEVTLLIFQLSQSPLELCELVISQCSKIFQMTYNEEKRITGIARFFCLLGKVAQLHLIMVDTILCRTQNSQPNETFIKNNGEYSKEDEEIQYCHSNSCNILNQLIYEKCLLSKYTHIIVQILKDQEFLNFASEFTSDLSITLSLILQLQSSALYAFSQFMLLSNHLCERYLNLIITLMTNHPSSFLRTSCLSALSDLTLRYPNTLQPWIPFVFMVLRDSNYSVRKHAVIILSHLVHIDMIKMQGYIVEIAYLIYDEDNSISELAHCFFIKIAQEGNSLYNVLPDILSHMFDLENNDLEIDIIKQILKFLFSLIRKEKHVGNLVIKFLQRLKLAKDNKQSQLISYSIFLLPQSECTLSVLVAEFSNVKSAIFDEQTKCHFVNIYNKVNRQPNLNQGIKDLLYKYFQMLNNIIIEEV